MFGTIWIISQETTFVEKLSFVNELKQMSPVISIAVGNIPINDSW